MEACRTVIRTRAALLFAALFLCAQIIIGSHFHAEGDAAGKGKPLDRCAVCLVKIAGNDGAGLIPAGPVLSSPLIETFRLLVPIVVRGTDDALRTQKWARGPPLLASPRQTAFPNRFNLKKLIAGTHSGDWLRAIPPDLDECGVNAGALIFLSRSFHT